MKNAKSDFADTCTCPQIILKFTLSGFSGIQTHDLFSSHCMILLVHQRAQFSRRLFSNDSLTVCFMTANRWKLIGCYQQTFSRLFKENAVCNWLLYQPLEKDSVLILLTLVLKNFFL